MYLPDRSDSTSFVIDKLISFFAAAIPRAQVEKMTADERQYTAADLERMNVSYLRLELVPRGVGTCRHILPFPPRAGRRTAPDPSVAQRDSRETTTLTRRRASRAFSDVISTPAPRIVYSILPADLSAW